MSCQLAISARQLLTGQCPAHITTNDKFVNLGIVCVLRSNFNLCLSKFHLYFDLSSQLLKVGVQAEKYYIASLLTAFSPTEAGSSFATICPYLKGQ